IVRSHPLIDGVTLGPQGRHAYFVHSFALNPSQRQDLVADADYGGPVTAIVGRDNIVGTQFHPEKSQKLGLALIANFLQWKPCFSSRRSILRMGRRCVCSKATWRGRRCSAAIQPRRRAPLWSRASPICIWSISTARLPASRSTPRQ